MTFVFLFLLSKNFHFHVTRERQRPPLTERVPTSADSQAPTRCGHRGRVRFTQDPTVGDSGRNQTSGSPQLSACSSVRASGSFDLPCKPHLWGSGIFSRDRSPFPPGGKYCQVECSDVCVLSQKTFATRNRSASPRTALTTLGRRAFRQGWKEGRYGVCGP